MITFSPISTRPSMVASPYRDSHLAGFPRRTSFGLTAGSRKHVEAGAGDLAGFDQLGQRRLVDHLAARGVTHIGCSRASVSACAPTADGNVAGVCGQFTEMMSIRANISGQGSPAIGRAQFFRDLRATGRRL